MDEDKNELSGKADEFEKQADLSYFIAYFGWHICGNSGAIQDIFLFNQWYLGGNVGYFAFLFSPCLLPLASGKRHPVQIRLSFRSFAFFRRAFRNMRVCGVA